MVHEPAINVKLSAIFCVFNYKPFKTVKCGQKIVLTLKAEIGNIEAYFLFSTLICLIGWPKIGQVENLFLGYFFPVRFPGLYDHYGRNFFSARNFDFWVFPDLKMQKYYLQFLFTPGMKENLICSLSTRLSADSLKRIIFSESSWLFSKTLYFSSCSRVVFSGPVHFTPSKEGNLVCQNSALPLYSLSLSFSGCS